MAHSGNLELMLAHAKENTWKTFSKKEIIDGLTKIGVLRQDPSKTLLTTLKDSCTMLKARLGLPTGEGAQIMYGSNNIFGISDPHFRLAKIGTDQYQWQFYGTEDYVLPPILAERFEHYY